MSDYNSTRGGNPLTPEEEESQKANTYVGYAIFGVIVVIVIIIGIASN